MRICRDVRHLLLTCICLQQLTQFISHLLSHTVAVQTLSIEHQVLRRQA
jgi:hypothetical protein